MKDMAIKRAIRTIGLALAGAAAWLPAAAGAQLFLHDPDFRPAPIDPADPLVGMPLPGATAAEQRAGLLWNLRAGLNVAALQCQFSPYMRAVDNYNDLLAHHSRELAQAYTALEGYFRRTHGAQGPRRFDDYSTITYNNFSTLDAQRGFCQTAGNIAKDALTIRKGELAAFATARMRELRNSLTAAHDYIIAYRPTSLPLDPALHAALQRPDCTRLRGRERRRCEAEA
jgi:hypothetical protein